MSAIIDTTETTADAGAIALSGVSKTFATANGETLAVLDNINLSVRSHSIVALLGASGCGKTTLLNVIAGLVKRLVGKARTVDGLSVDFSGTHSQPDDEGSNVLAGVIFGTPAMAEKVESLKKKVDPTNRFRFHPFAKFL
jgi:ABC-type lipoprotein export system ATPase subunit